MKFLISKLGKVLLWIARLKPSGAAIGFIFEHFPFFIRFSYIFENEYFVAFKHPVPVKRGHVLLIPKKCIASPVEFLSIPGNIERIIHFLRDIENRLHYGNFSLSTNIGCRQEVMQVHFHLLPSDATFQRSTKEPEAVAKIKRCLVKEIRSSPELKSLEFCYESHISERALQEGFADTVGITSEIIRASRGATIFMYFKVEESKLILHPTLRIVLEKSSWSNSIISMLPAAQVS